MVGDAPLSQMRRMVQSLTEGGGGVPATTWLNIHTAKRACDNPLTVLNTTVFWPIDDDPVDCNVGSEKRVNTKAWNQDQYEYKQNAYRQKQNKKRTIYQRIHLTVYVACT
jgi:hypothetical protein